MATGGSNEVLSPGTSLRRSEQAQALRGQHEGLVLGGYIIRAIGMAEEALGSTSCSGEAFGMYGWVLFDFDVDRKVCKVRGQV